MLSSETMEIQVSVNGDQMPGLLRASVATTNCFAADTYSITFAMGGSGNIAFWSMVSSAYLEVTAVVSSAVWSNISEPYHGNGRHSSCRSYPGNGGS